MEESFEINPDIVYIIPKTPKPIKVKHEPPCPLDSNIWCKYSEILHDGLNIVIECKCIGECKYGIK